MIGHSVVIAATVVAVGAIVAVAVYSHHYSTAQIYTAAVSRATADDVSWEHMQPIVHEGVRWARNAHYEANIWAVALIVLLVVVLGWSFWKEGLSSRR